MENYWGLLQYPWMKIHPAQYNNWLQYFTMNTTLMKWLKNGFAKHQTRLEFQYFIPLRKSTNRLNWETSVVSGPTEKLSGSICCHTTPAFSTTTEVVSQRLSRLIQSTDAINFIDRTKVPESAILESLDVTSLYTNIHKRGNTYSMQGIRHFLY